MLNLDQDKFITDFVTTYLASHAVERCRDDGEFHPIHHAYEAPVAAAIQHARKAWYEILRQIAPPMPSRLK